MSATTAIPRSAVASARERAAGWVVATCGLVVLVLRVEIGTAYAAPILLAIGVASMATPIARGRRRLPTAAVLGIGAAAVVAAAATAGPSVPVPFGAATAALVVGAAVAEELLFRRLLYGLLEPLGAAAAVGLSALAFALVHVPLYGVAAFPVDLGAGLMLSWQRWASGGWSAPAATHAFANLLVILR